MALESLPEPVSPTPKAFVTTQAASGPIGGILVVPGEDTEVPGGISSTPVGELSHILGSGLLLSLLSQGLGGWGTSQGLGCCTACRWEAVDNGLR